MQPTFNPNDIMASSCVLVFEPKDYYHPLNMEVYIEHLKGSFVRFSGFHLPNKGDMYLTQYGGVKVSERDMYPMFGPRFIMTLNDIDGKVACPKCKHTSDLVSWRIIKNGCPQCNTPIKTLLSKYL